ncbi:haloacid dehalogenase-like hydrolase [Streptococcus pneumoniae]|nr:haloacid dehalogenase-like hydrolase [Streptococcus pneumoniae]
MTIKLVATDMDGTFLDGNGRFDMDRLKSLLVSYKEKGIYFAVASGRGFLSLGKLFAGVRDDIIFIAENGSLVEYQGQDLYEATMSRDFYLATFEKLKTSPYVDINKLLLTGKKGSYVLDTVDETYLKVSQHYNENIQKVASLEDITDDIFKFTTNFTEETLEAGEAWVNDNVPGVKAMTTGFESIDIVLDYVDKGVAIVELAKKLGITMDQVMAFGDNLNDLHMMQVVGHPVAPENARSEILELAETVIGHHKDQSVIAYMEGLYGGLIMADIKLIALDLDGTLLTTDKRLTDRTKATLKAARDRGIKVVLTTGRPLKAMDFFLHELGTDGHEDEYTITFNGGLVQKNTGEILDKTVFSYDDVARLYEETEKLSLPLDAISEGTVYQIQSDQESLYAKFNPALTFVPVDFEDLSSQMTYNKCVTAFAQEPLDAAIQKISPELFDQYEIFKSREMLLEWSPKNVHKATGLAKLISHLGIDQSQVMACGDEANDLSMIEWAGLGVAMQNAVPEVKAAANVVTPMTNDEEAVAWAIEEYVLKEK